MEYSEAILKAYDIRKILKPYCVEIQVAGSLRRKRPEIKDIELIAISKEIELKNLFGECVEPYLVIEEFVEDYGFQFSKNGPKYKKFLYEGISIDLFITTKYQYGLHMALRTGSKEYSRWLVTPKRKGGAMPGYMSVSGGWLTANGKKIITYTEQDFFRAIETEWVRPDQREVGLWG